MEEIKPRGIIERLYVADIAALVWEILRLRRCKVVIVNTAFKKALSNIVSRLAESQKFTPRKGMVRGYRPRLVFKAKGQERNSAIARGISPR